MDKRDVINWLKEKDLIYLLTLSFRVDMSFICTLSLYKQLIYTPTITKCAHIYHLFSGSKNLVLDLYFLLLMFLKIVRGVYDFLSKFQDIF